MTKVLVEQTTCLDGSRAGYYYAPGSSNLWVIAMQGGGACFDQSSCDQRAGTKLGSSKHWSGTMTGKGISSSDSGENPDFAKAHHVFVPYCTGDVHSGQGTTPTDKTWGYYFTGHTNFDTIVSHLNSTVRDFATADRILLTGGSAGGIGTFRSCDYLAGRVSSEVSCAPIGGMFFPGFSEDQADPDLPPSDFPHYSAGKSGGPFHDAAIYELWQEYLHPKCKAKMGASMEWKCTSEAVEYPFIEAPVMVIENMYDTFQLFEEMGLKKSDATTTAGKEYIAYYGRAMRNSTDQVIHHPFGKKGDAMFVASCLDHTSGIGTTGSTMLGGKTSLEAIGDWFFKRGATPELVDTCTMQPPGLPCNPTCPGVVASSHCEATLRDLCADSHTEGDCRRCAAAMRGELREEGCTAEVAADMCADHLV